MVAECKVCPWCLNRLVNMHWKCLKDAAATAKLETRYGYARNRWGAESKHPDTEWYGTDD